MTFDTAMADETPVGGAAASGGMEISMDFDAPKKPLGKKPELGKRPVKKPAAPKDAGGDEELAQPEPPKKGPPARLANRAAAAASSGPTKTVKASDI